ncbi:uncharacterized protein [Pocillopora verrucosa]|uniref:uncharacterized protein n=1 Tax=Pocillopora verrucosa TaxID=203993 RepID=UPI003341713C
MTGIAKVIVSFFRKGEEVAIERHRSRASVDKEAHRGVSELKKHLTEFLGLKEQAHQYGIGGFSFKLFRLAKSPAGKCENFAILTDGQWQLELPNLISDESSSELNVHIIQVVTNWTGKPVVLLKAPATSDKSKQKSMNDTEKKGDESKVRRKRKSREEAKEDENLAKRIMTEGGDIERNKRQQGELQKFQDGRAELALVVRLPDFQKS